MIFEPITLNWEGRDYTIPPDQVMRCIAQVEEVVTLGELTAYHLRRVMPMAKLSQAFGIILRYAGAEVTDEQVYAGMFKKGEQQKRAVEAVQTLMLLMVPPSTYKTQGAEAKKGAPADVTRSSRKPSRRR